MRVVVLLLLAWVGLGAEDRVLARSSVDEHGKVTVELWIGRGDWDRIRELVEATPSYRTLRRRASAKVTIWVASRDGDSFDVGVGEDFPDVWHRLMSLRVYRDGTVLREDYNRDLDIVWMAEAGPDF
jgi:hypothetical protein